MFDTLRGRHDQHRIKGVQPGSIAVAVGGIR